MDSRQSMHNLTESIHSLLGTTTHLTSSWADSVCEIVKSLSSTEQSAISNYAEIPETEEDPTGSNHADLDAVLLKTKDELADLAACRNLLNIQRREVLNEYLNLKVEAKSHYLRVPGNIRVYCRLRPATLKENFSQSMPVQALDSSSVLLQFKEGKSKLYTFDKVFHPTSSQEEVFSEIEPVIKSVLDGYNACIFAYGQTGAGKTFTMEGTPDDPGIVPRAAQFLFEQADHSNQTFFFGFSMLEMYLGNLRDLLFPLSTNAAVMPPPLAIQADPRGGIQIENLVTIQSSGLEQTLMLYRLGCQCRSTASTNANISSSRSHCMIRITMTCFDDPERKKETNKLWLIDLGGSERLLKTKAWGRRLEEGKAINLSLSALGDVISALQKKKRHIPYRNSKLTRVLRDSLGEDSKALMLVHISPNMEDLCETLCSVNFATRARGIHLKNEESAEASHQKEVAMANLQRKIKDIEVERQDVIIKVDNLKKRLESLAIAASSSIEPDNVSEFSSKTVPHFTGDDANKSTEDVKVAANLSLLLPRFMRPTFSSRKKIGMPNKTSEEEIPTPFKWRTVSHRVDSGTANSRIISERYSECSISKFSCKQSADCETDYSRETSEYDIKTDVFPVHDVSLRSYRNRKARLHNKGGTKNRSTFKMNSRKFLKVDEWLHLHKNEHSASDHSYRKKGVHALFMPEKKSIHGHTREKLLNEEEEREHSNAKQKVAQLDKVEKLTESGLAENCMSEIVTEKAVPLSLKDLFDEECSSSSSNRSQADADEIVIQEQVEVESLSDGENENDLFAPMPPLHNISHDEHRCIENETSDVEVVVDEQCSTLSTNNCANISSPNIENVVDVPEYFATSVSISEQEPSHQGLPMQLAREDHENEDFGTSSQQSSEAIRSNLHTTGSEEDLTLCVDSQKGHPAFLWMAQAIQQSSGKYGLILQKLKSIRGCLLLGLGFQNLGLDHEFFHALTL